MVSEVDLAFNGASTWFLISKPRIKIFLSVCGTRWDKKKIEKAKIKYKLKHFVSWMMEMSVFFFFFFF